MAWDVQSLSAWRLLVVQLTHATFSRNVPNLATIKTRHPIAIRVGCDLDSPSGLRIEMDAAIGKRA
jgi:hypothetical protein